MKSLALLLTALVAAGLFLSMQPIETPALQQSSIAQRFQTWSQSLGKRYLSVELEAYRMSVFAENVARIEAENAAQSEYTLGETQFTDITQEEFVAQYLGYIATSTETVEETEYQVPNAAFTWQGKGVITPVKNQGQCGSCWAFSATGTIEGYWAINKGSLPDLSEQQLVDCVGITYGCLGCNGGQMSGALKYVKANGITTQAAYPYTGRDGTCKTKTGAYKIQ